MGESNLELVERLFASYAERGVDGVLEGLDEQIAIEVPPELSAEPDSYHGHEGVRRYFAGFEGMLEDVVYEAVELIPAGEYVLARIRLGGRGSSSGLEVELEAVVVHELRDGKITLMRPYPSLDSALEAVGC